MNAQTISGLLVAALALACIVVVLAGLRIALRRTALAPSQQKSILAFAAAGVAAWLLLTGGLAVRHVFMAPSFPPRPMLTVVVALAVLATLSFSPPLKAVLRATPLHWLVFFQSFRILVELWFWQSYQSGVMPRMMTFEGANLDILSGLLAVAAGWLMLRRPGRAGIIALVFNIAGILLLLNTLMSAALSMPSPLQRFPFDARLQLVGAFPFIYLPAVLVVLALGFHILSLRQLYLQRGVKSVRAVLA